MLPQGLGQVCESRCGLLGKGLSGNARTQTLGIRHCPLELLPNLGAGQVLQLELVGFADTVGPVGADAEPNHVRDDQQRRVLEGKGVLPQLLKGPVEIGMLAFVFPCEVPPLPHVGPSCPARVLARTALEAVDLAGGVGFGRRGFTQQAAQVDEVLLTAGTLFQFRPAPLVNKVMWLHSIGGVGHGTCLPFHHGFVPV